MREQRILMVIDSLAAGGAERVALNLAAALQKEGYSIDIITIDDIVSYDLDEKIGYKTLSFKKGFLDYYRYERKLHKMIRALEAVAPYKQIIVHLQKSTRLMRNFKHEQLLFVVHSTLSQASLSGRTGLRRYLKARRLKNIYDTLNIVAVSEGIAEDIKAIGIVPRTLRVINNPVDAALLHQKAMEPSGCIQEQDYIVYVGRLARSKRHDRAIEAYSKSGADVDLLLVGEGEQRAAIENLIADKGLEKKVKLCGFQANPYPIIKEAKALILTSDYEGLPTVLIEALILGVPVISTDCPSGPREILGDEMPEALVGVDDLDGLTLKISEVLSNAPVISKQLLSRFDGHKIAKAYLEKI